MSGIHIPANILPNPKQEQQLERVASCIHDALKTGKDWCSINERLTHGAQKILRDRDYMLQEITRGTPDSYSRGLPVGSTIINFLVDAHLEGHSGPTVFVAESLRKHSRNAGCVTYGANGSVTYGADGSVTCHVPGKTDVQA